MTHPVDEATFAKLVAVRREMEGTNRNREIGIAAPFVPWLGSDILAGSVGIYFVGISTHANAEDSNNYNQRRRWSERVVREPDSTPFWRYVTSVAETAYERKYKQCLSRIAWSNQLKVGIFWEENPSRPCRFPRTLGRVQEKVCVQILKEEMQFARNCVVVFMGDPAVDIMTPAVLEGKDWDKKKHKDLNIWMLERPDRGPVFYQCHPRVLKGEQFSGHVDVLSSAVKEHLVKQADGPG